MDDWTPLLVTSAEVVSYAAETVDDIADLALLAARTAQAGLDDWLGYEAFAHVARARVPGAGRRVRFDLSYGAVPGAATIVPVGPASVALDADVSVDTSFDAFGRLDVSAVGDLDAVRYVSGWRRPGQSDADVLAVLTDDGASPVIGPGGEAIEAADLADVPAAPQAIVSALAEAAVVVARRLAQGAGKGPDTTTIGEAAVTGPDYRLSNVNRLIGRVTEVEAVFASRLQRFRHLEV